MRTEKVDHALVLKCLLTGHIESFPRSNLKVKIDINGVSQSECQWLFGSLNQTIIESQLCAGGMKQVDTWYGYISVFIYGNHVQIFIS